MTETKARGHTPERTVLDNGLRVLTSAMPHSLAVTISAFVGAGSRYEHAELAGISHLVEHLVFKGTKRRPNPREISTAVEGVGGEINAGTEQELTVYWCKIAKPHWEDGLDLLLDMLRNSLYDEADIDKERLVVMEEQRMVNDYPPQKVDVLIDQMLWPDHPLGREISGTRESLARISRDLIIDQVSRFHTPSNIVVSLAGDVDHAQVIRKVDSLSDGWAPGPAPEWIPFTQTQSAPQLSTLFQRTEQAHFSAAFAGLSATHPDRYALDLLNVVLGEGMSSRLFLEVREKQGMAYDIHSSVAHYQDCGAFFINAGVDPKRAYAAVETTLAEVGRMKESVPIEELERAKRLIVGRLMLSMEDTRAVSMWAGSHELLLAQAPDVDQVVERVNRVGPEDIRKVASEILVTEKLNLAVLGPIRGTSRLRGLLSL